MDVKAVRFYVLDVGQGSCNYVEIVDSLDVVTHNMLIDLGTNSSQAIATKNVQWLRDQIQGRPNPRIDVIIITHGDTDHYNLMLRLLPALQPEDTSRIGMVRYGGVAWRYQIGKVSLIDELKKYCTDVNGLAVNQSSLTLHFGAPPTWNPIWPAAPDAADPKLQLILANTPHPKDPKDSTKKQKLNAEAVNTKSVVCAIEWEGWWMVGTGDATADTMSQINFQMGLAPSLPPTFMLTVPHHGSRKTTYNLKAAKDLPKPVATKVVDDFLALFKPQTISVSAGEKRHHHPSMLMLTQFAKATNQVVQYWSDPALAPEKRHFLTSWIDLPILAPVVLPQWPMQWQYAATQTAQNIYSTLYFKSDPYNRSYVKAGVGGAYFLRYICPPVFATQLPLAGADQIGIPMGRNWTFMITATQLNVTSKENVARALADKPELALAAGAPPLSAFTSAGRSARAALAAPAPGAARPTAPPRPATRSIAEPAGPRLRALRPIA